MGGGWKLAVAAVFGAGAIALGAAMGSPAWGLVVIAIASLGLVVAVGVVQGRGSVNALRIAADREAELEGRVAQLDRGLVRIHETLDSMDEPVMTIGADGLIAGCNPAAEELLGVKTERLLRRPVEDAFTQADLLSLYEQARGGKRVREQVRLARPEGIRVWDVSAVPLSGETGVLLCLRDVTGTALAMQVRTDFVANASHELRTPIAAMRVALDTMGALEAGDERMRERLQRVIAANVARLEEMVRDLLDLSRLETAEAGVDRRSVSITELAAELRSAYEPVCAARRLTLSFDLDVEQIRSDKSLLGLILGNLIDNSAKYAFEGTEVRVAARAVPSGNGKPPGARFEVIDRGIGIPLDQQQRVFERYYQVDAARTPGQPRRGTGLGLAIVKHAVRRLGGTVRVQSVWQQGTTMIVELPDCVET